MPSGITRDTTTSSSSPRSGELPGQADPGFTLIEILVVAAVMVVMMTLAIPAFNAIRGGTDFTSEVYSIAGAYEQARAYAVANNTYVLAGIVEVSAAQASSASPQVSGTGTIAMAIVASKSGTRPYQSLFPNGVALGTWYSNSGVYNSDNGGALLFSPVTKLQVFNNIHLVDLQVSGTSAPPWPMARPVVTAAYNLSNANTGQANKFNTQFAWPLGVKFSPTGIPQYTFEKVVEFDPQGSARVISSSNTVSYPNAIPQYIEIGLQPAHGTIAAGPPPDQATHAGQIAAIQINGICGAVQTYRP